MRRRVITAAIGIPIVLAALLARSPIPFSLLLAATLAVGLSELRALGVPRINWVLVAMTLLLPIAAMVGGGTNGLLLLCLWLSFLYGLVSLVEQNGIGGPAWLTAPLASLAFLQWSMMPASGGAFAANPVLLAIVPLWGGDTAAIFAGKAFGRHPMAPKISPNKTWEGGIANFAACVLVGGVLGIALGVEAWRGWACGVTCGVFGQVGDLFESSLKRRAGVKDSGSLLPGHGGVLDRIDSMLFSALPAATILLL
ncbi:MAG TPA: phosphatidate cytidylyltransferase [Fimbriimonadaceae bacterium]|nr:phosphatidate cytidylyltransferase [Fimbriimonadaceae bacterium]